MKKLIAAVLGLAVFLALLEGGLRLAGHWHRARPGSENLNGAIVCYGNSYTEGVGAPPGQSYCDQLGRLAEGSGRKVAVVNRGAAFTNSYHLLMALRRDLATARPGLVLIMTGEQNFANFEGYARFLRNSQAPTAPGPGPLDAFKAARLFRLLTGALRGAEAASLYFPETPLADISTLGFRWAGGLASGAISAAGLAPAERAEALASMLALSDRPEAAGSRVLALALARAELSNGDARAALHWYERSLTARPGGLFLPALSDLRQLLGRPGLPLENEARHLLPEGGRAESAQHRLRDALRPEQKARAYSGPNPAEQLASLELACHDSAEDADCAILESVLRERLGRKREALAPLFVAIREDPFGGGPRVLDRLLLYRDSLPKEEAVQREVATFLAELRQRFPSAAVLETSDRDSIPAWIESDLTEMSDLLRAEGVPFILQTYPPRRNGGGRPADAIVREFAARRGVPLSDTQAKILELIRGGVDPARLIFSDQYGVNDDHLSAQGYGRIAQFLFDEISARRLWP